MKELDKQILSSVQKVFPVYKRPFKLLGNNFGLTESEMIEKFKYFTNEIKIIRSITPVFNPSKLGYKSVLVALHLNEEQITHIPEKINNFSSVSHNYQRDDYYNIWFTYTSNQNDNYEFLINTFCKENNINEHLFLPSIQVFNREVIFNLANEKLDKLPDILNSNNESIYELDDLDKKIIIELQNNLPLISQPYKSVAEKIGIKEPDLIYKIKKYLEYKVINRYCVSVNHLKTPFKYNALVTWNTERALIKNISKLFISFDFVSHCYERILLPQWPYNLYTMVHSTSEDNLTSNINQMIKASNITSYKVLKTIHELKKKRVKYLLT